MADGICESLWLNTLFQELAFKHNSLTTLHYDTISVLYFAKNPIYHEHTKHTDLDCHFIREEIKRKEIQLDYANKYDQVVDFLTKAVTKKELSNVLSKSSIGNICTNMRESTVKQNFFQ